jgi:hypothetical protein
MRRTGDGRMDSAMLQRSIHLALTAGLAACVSASTACSTCPALEVDDGTTPAQLELRYSQGYLAQVADAGTLIFTEAGVARVHGGEGVGCGDSATAFPSPCIVALDRVQVAFGSGQGDDAGTAQLGIALADSNNPDLSIGAQLTLDAPTKPGHYALADLHATLCDAVCSPIDGAIDVQAIGEPCDQGACGHLDADVSFVAPASPSSAVPSLSGTARLHYAESITQTYCGGGGPNLLY